MKPRPVNQIMHNQNAVSLSRIRYMLVPMAEMQLRHDYSDWDRPGSDETLNRYSPAPAGVLLHKGDMPAGATILGGINLTRSVPHLPHALRVVGSLNGSWNPAISIVGNDLAVQLRLYLDDCPLLSAIGQRLRVGRDCSLRGNPVLEVIGDGMEIAGSLDLTGSLRCRLGPNSRIGGNLILSSAYVTSLLPPDLRIGGQIIFA